MKRRAFLRLIGLAAATAIGAMPKVGFPFSRPGKSVWMPACWKDVRWHVKSFGHGAEVGVALEIVNPVTDKMTRQAARFSLVGLSEEQAVLSYIARHGTSADARADKKVRPHKNLRANDHLPRVLEDCRAILTEWSHEEAYRQGLLAWPQGWRPDFAATPSGISDWEVLEGHEFIHPDRPEVLRRFVSIVKSRYG